MHHAAAAEQPHRVVDGPAARVVVRGDRPGQVVRRAIVERLGRPPVDRERAPAVPLPFPVRLLGAAAHRFEDRVGVEVRALVIAHVAALVVRKEHEPRVRRRFRLAHDDAALVPGDRVFGHREERLDPVPPGEEAAGGDVDRRLRPERALRRSPGPGDLVRLRRSSRGQQGETNGETGNDRTRDHATSSE